MFRPEQILEKKSALFSIVVAGVVGILAAPVILPHVFHGLHIVHILLHVGGITLASFLTILSTLAYFRLKSKKLQSQQNLLLKKESNLRSSLFLSENNRFYVNQIKNEKSFKLKIKKEVLIYPYSLSSNLIKEVLLRMGLKFVLTNKLIKASFIIGMKKHLKQNPKFIHLANQKNIPLYSLDQENFYQISKLLQVIHLKIIT